MIQAIFFDFNGVIIDDEPLQMKAYQEVFGAQGIELSERDYYAALGMDDKGLIRATLKRANKPLTEEAVNSVLEHKTILHRQYMAELPLFPGIVTFLKAVSRAFPLGLISMAMRDEIEYAMNRAGLMNLFSVVVTADDVSVCKPAPDCYRMGLEKLNEWRRERRELRLLPNECLAIEDSPPGIEAGRGAGMRTLGVTNTVSEKELRAAGADVVTPSLSDWSVDSVKHVFS